MAARSCDVLVIGGGATGVCAAYDAARRGLRVILTEMNDLTTGTSGRYHGLLHSGARYVVNDPESAHECIQENRILRRIAPQIVEDTGGLFVAAAHDPADFVPVWEAGCAAVGIEHEELSIAAARRLEPALRPDLARAFRVPDGAVDGFDLGHVFTRAAESFGAETLLYHAVTALAYGTDGMVATLADRRSGETKTVAARWVLNAAGPWAGEVAALAGHDLTVRWSRGLMIAMNVRWVNTIINRLRPPDDGDILVPVGTVSVIGTTSVPVERPDDHTIEAWEVSDLLAEGEAVIGGFREARALRAWAGVRPLYEPPGEHAGAQGRAVRRTFAVVRHGTGLTTVVGGKLTTARLMAEKALDDICAGLGIDARCTTADERLPMSEHGRRYHTLGGRLAKLEHGQMPGALICECELVSQRQLEEAINAYTELPSLDDLRRDLRLGMGPCQGGFCAVRATSILRHARDLPAPEAVAALRAFVDERFKGGRPLLWGQQLRQFLLDEMIYRRTLGLDRWQEPRAVGDITLPSWARASGPLPDGTGRRVVVIGAGLAGLAAAIQAVQTGAHVQVVATGIGRLLLTPGWYALGAFREQAGVAAFRAWL
ncbi:MAG: anaerobic glycerol-3-phosphate dehydrogenase subunit A, partial [Anaerolineae bacterium]|nr:anaerobic glycerol-3-phosphate dehydrogenase subunit A [Anaerolineae bacterium]